MPIDHRNRAAKIGQIDLTNWQLQDPNKALALADEALQIHPADFDFIVRKGMVIPTVFSGMD